MRYRHFSIEEANALLPWLEAKLAQVMPVRDELARRQGDLAARLQQRRGNGSTSSDEDIGEAQRAVDRLVQQLQEELQEIADQGIILRDLASGLVDFPSYREGREVYLCWLRGEERIAYWHETDTGFSGRQPL